MDKLEDRIQKALNADPDGLRALLYDPSDKVVLALLSNRNITEDEVCALARRRDVSAEALSVIAARKMTEEGYKIRLALVNNPKTPRRAALGQIRYLRLLDMAYLTSNKTLPTELRQLAEGVLKEKLPMIPLGVRITLARLVSEDVVKALLMDETPALVKACFDNPRVKEGVAIWALSHEKIPGGVIRFIAESPKWSVRYLVRFALVRNRRTPAELAVDLVCGLKSKDLRYLYNDPTVPVYVKVKIEIELEKKGEPLSPPKETGRVVRIVEELDEEP